MGAQVVAPLPYSMLQQLPRVRPTRSTHDNNKENAYTPPKPPKKKPCNFSDGPDHMVHTKDDNAAVVTTPQQPLFCDTAKVSPAASDAVAKAASIRAWKAMMESNASLQSEARTPEEPKKLVLPAGGDADPPALLPLDEDTRSLLQVTTPNCHHLFT